VLKSQKKWSIFTIILISVIVISSVAVFNWQRTFCISYGAILEDKPKISAPWIDLFDLETEYDCVLWHRPKSSTPFADNNFREVFSLVGGYNFDSIQRLSKIDSNTEDCDFQLIIDYFAFPPWKSVEEELKSILLKKKIQSEEVYNEYIEFIEIQSDEFDKLYVHEDEQKIQVLTQWKHQIFVVEYWGDKSTKKLIQEIAKVLLRK
jgi:hypothetical protein